MCIAEFPEEDSPSDSGRASIRRCAASEKVHVIVVIVDGVQQSQQTALHPAKLHGLGEDENGVRYFLGIIQIRLLFHLFLPQILFSFLGDLHIVTIPQFK